MESSPQTSPSIQEKVTSESSPYTNGNHSSMDTNYVPTSTPTNTMNNSEEPKPKKKTVDLLFEMKQHKLPNEKQGKKIQQQHGRQRAQHKKRALDYFSMANFIDQAFGLNKDDLEKQLESNGYHTSSSSTPQVIIQMNSIYTNREISFLDFANVLQ